MSTGAAGTCVLVPMKDFARAKSRLRGHLEDAARAELARNMFERVLAAACGCELVQSTYVITDGLDVARRARARGAQVLTDPTPALPGLGALLDWGLAQLRARGALRALVLMGDLPGLEPSDVRSLCALLDRYHVVAVPDGRGRSTNALGVRLPYQAATAFGDPDSYTEHLRRSRALGLAVCEHASPGLAHDVDLVADL